MVLIFACASVTACSSTQGRPLNFEPPPAESWMTQSGFQTELGTSEFSGSTLGTSSGTIPGKTEILLPGTPNSYDLPQPITTLAMQGCSIKDRFDRKASIAYNFDDDQSRLAFNLKMKGPSFSDPGRLEFRGLELRFTYKLQKDKKSKKQHCLYNSPVQGVIGSLYNEFSARESDTIVQELRAKGLDF